MTTVTMISMLSGKRHTLDLPLTSDELQAGELKHRHGAPIQDAYPMLSPEEREFLLTGITPEEWDAAFGEPEEDC